MDVMREFPCMGPDQENCLARYVKDQHDILRRFRRNHNYWRSNKLLFQHPDFSSHYNSRYQEEPQYWDKVFFLFPVTA